MYMSIQCSIWMLHLKTTRCFVITVTICISQRINWFYCVLYIYVYIYFFLVHICRLELYTNLNSYENFRFSKERYKIASLRAIQSPDSEVFNYLIGLTRLSNSYLVLYTVWIGRWHFLTCNKPEHLKTERKNYENKYFISNRKKKLSMLLKKQKTLHVYSKSKRQLSSLICLII